MMDIVEIYLLYYFTHKDHFDCPLFLYPKIAEDIYTNKGQKQHQLKKVKVLAEVMYLLQSTEDLPKEY